MARLLSLAAGVQIDVAPADMVTVAHDAGWPAAGIWFDGKTWTEPRVVAKVRNDPHWNPVLHRDENGKMILFFKVGKEIDHWEIANFSIGLYESFGHNWVVVVHVILGKVVERKTGLQKQCFFKEIISKIQ